MIVLFVLLISSSIPAHCSLISQSVIKQCTAGDPAEPKTNDGRDCGKKFVVTMTLKGGQVAY